MMRVALVLVVLGACGDDGGGDNNPRPDAGNDLDFDGVPNDTDNCPSSSNAFQGNEDGDAFGDACDPCPPIANDSPPDGDGDGVADACDPKPIMFGDKVLFFEGFHQGKPQGWEENGTWAASMDRLRANATAAQTFALILTDRTRETVTARVTVVSTTGTGEVGVLDNKMQNGTPGIACTITATPTVSVYNTANVAGAMTSAFEMTAGQTYEIRLQRENSAYTCTAKNVASSAMATATQSISLSNAPYLSGLTVAGANVRVDWFMLVESL